MKERNGHVVWDTDKSPCFLSFQKIKSQKSSVTFLLMENACFIADRKKL